MRVLSPFSFICHLMYDKYLRTNIVLFIKLSCDLASWYNILSTHGLRSKEEEDKVSRCLRFAILSH